MNEQLVEYAASNGRTDERTDAEIDAAMDRTPEVAVAEFDLVPPDDACTCGECRVDWLMWLSDGINVKCHSCGTIFRPGGAR